MQTTTKTPHNSTKIWTFELFHNPVTGKWIVYADGKHCINISEEDAEEAPEAMKKFIEEWEEGNIEF